MKSKILGSLLIGLSLILPNHVQAFDFSKTQQITFSASANRQDVPSAFGLYKGEAVADYTSFKIKLPSGMEGKDAHFKESNIAFAPINKLYFKYKESKDHLEGSTKYWDANSKEIGGAYKIYESGDNKHAIALTYSKRMIDIDDIKPKAGYTDGLNFIDKTANWHSAGIVFSKCLNFRSSFHINYENIKLRMASDKTTTNKYGLGYDYIPSVLKDKLKIEANALFLKDNSRSSNKMFSGRLIYNISKGLNISLDAGMFTNGMPVGGTRFSDQGIGSYSIEQAKTIPIPDTIKKFKDDKFGYYGVTLTYGVKF